MTSKSEKLLKAYDGWVYANVKAIAQKVSEMEFKLYQAGYTKGELEYKEIDQHEILDLLDRFNPFTTCNDALFMIDSHLLLAGDTFILKERSGGKVSNLFILDPTKVTVIPGDANEGYIVERYDYKDTVQGKTVTVSYDPNDIIPIKEPNPGNPYRGKSIVEAAAQAIDTDSMAGEWNKNFFKNSAVPQATLETEQRMSREDIDRLERDMRRNFGGHANSNKTMVLTGGLSMKQVSTNQKDMEFRAQQEWTRDKIMALFGNTKTSLGIVEDVNRANAEATMGAWLKNTIKPRMKRIVNSLNEFLIPEYGENLILGFENPVGEDRDAMVDEASTLAGGQGGIPLITVNEARELLDYDPIVGGDELSSGQAATPMGEEVSDE